jgi:poly-gamma-glutamate synthesis protein (capsule biosynthesis protein)
LCANPESIETLDELGVNVVELTGNHENDYGTESFAQTLKMYEERGWLTFGGGRNEESARKPALIENNGNKIAFIGCNPIGYSSAWATEDSPGAAKCDYDYMFSQITELKSQGYIVIATFQHNEIYEYMYSEPYREDFKKAVQAGADIVQGSQAHFPMGFELINTSLIHYGLGNFLFDQMDIPVVGTKREFVDRHIVYNGKFINTEVLTAVLTDWAKPVPMQQEERSQLLYDIFKASQRRFP